MKSKDGTYLEMRELQLGSKRWIIPVPVNVSNVNEVTRSATRDPDVPLIAPSDRKWVMLFLGLGLIVVCLFLLAYEVGLASWFYELFIR